MLGGIGQTKPEQTTGKYLVRQKQQIQLPACCLQVQSAERLDLDLEGVKPRLRRQLKELEELMKQKKQKKVAEKKEEEVRLVLGRTGKGPEDYDFLPAMV